MTKIFFYTESAISRIGSEPAIFGKHAINARIISRRSARADDGCACFG